MVVPARVAKHGHIPPPLVVDHCIFGLFILKVGRFTFSLKPLLVCPDQPLSWETLIWFEYHELCSLCPSKLFPPKEGGALCHLCLSWPWLFCCAGHSFYQVCGSCHCLVLAPHLSLLLSLTSTVQCHRQQLEFWDPLSFCVVTLALWSLSSSLLQPQGLHGNLLVWFSLKLLFVLISWPI